MRWPFQDALALNSFTTFERTVQVWESWMLRPGRRRFVGDVGSGFAESVGDPMKVP